MPVPILDRDVAVISGAQGDGVQIGVVGRNDPGRLMEEMEDLH